MVGLKYRLGGNLGGQYCQLLALFKSMKTGGITRKRFQKMFPFFFYDLYIYIDLISVELSLHLILHSAKSRLFCTVLVYCVWLSSGFECAVEH